VRERRPRNRWGDPCAPLRAEFALLLFLVVLVVLLLAIIVIIGLLVRVVIVVLVGVVVIILLRVILVIILVVIRLVVGSSSSASSRSPPPPRPRPRLLFLLLRADAASGLVFPSPDTFASKNLPRPFSSATAESSSPHRLPCVHRLARRSPPIRELGISERVCQAVHSAFCLCGRPAPTYREGLRPTR
jgi:hypothetical protein